MNRHYYADTISSFRNTSSDEILGALAKNNEFSTESLQVSAWIKQIEILKAILTQYEGGVFFEYAIPRMGKRIDVLLIIEHILFVMEFKVGETEFTNQAIDQVWDYCLDLKNFHESSHNQTIVPILIATEAKTGKIDNIVIAKDNVLEPIKSSPADLPIVIQKTLEYQLGGKIDINAWSNGRYSPSPSIIEAAIALYKGHSVSEISRSDASAENLSLTSTTISDIIYQARQNKFKAICFVTGVPGAGKTLVGLDIATKHLQTGDDFKSVFLSGNGPLVAILREALTRDRVTQLKKQGAKVKKGEVMSKVKSFIQNVHHYRDEYLRDKSAPVDHIAIFDEAQRAWNLEQTVNFMQRKKGLPNFHMSEPEFLISCLDRHKDWAVIVCLVGGGQEINTGEGGISEWIQALNRSFPEWRAFISNNLVDSEYAAGKALDIINNKQSVTYKAELHLGVSLRSFRSESLSRFVKSILDIEIDVAKTLYNEISVNYPLVLTRDLSKAKKWLKEKARGSERYGIVVSSQAQRLKPYAIDVKSPIDPIHWFLDDKEDVRSSFYLEDVATEFQVQGLELDWACVTWDGDFRYTSEGWEHFSFVGSRWNQIRKAERKEYLKNAYRVLLTRARQGMVIVVPEGSNDDPTRNDEFYFRTYDYLRSIGISELA
jgi:hypothetical protein